MLIDVNTYAGHWPFRALVNNSLQAVCDNAEKNGITHVVTASLNAVFYRNPTDGNRELMAEMKNLNTSVKVLPLAVVNPNYPNWEKFARRAIAEEGFVGFEIFPQYHGYGFRPIVNPAEPYKNIYPGSDLLKLAKELDVPVRINMAFENFRQRHHMDVTFDPAADDLYMMLSTCPGVKVIINSTNPLGLGEKMEKYINENKATTVFDITRSEGLAAGTAKIIAEKFGTEIMCFGTMMPFQYPESNLVKLKYVKEFVNQGIEDVNARKIFPNL